jgi:hypothetical protein
MKKDTWGHGDGQIVESKPHCGPFEKSTMEFSRTACACSIYRHLERVLKIPKPIAKMIAARAVKFAESQALDEIT